jgi:uncharacterized protein
MFTLGSLRVAQGGKTQGFLPIINPEGVSLELPVVLVHGTAPGPVLWITAGIHGAEYPPIEAAIRLARDVDPHRLCGMLIVSPVVDPTAFFARSMYVCPVDHKNLNRVFPGNAAGSLSERIASTLMQAIAPHVSHVIDLHGGDMVESLCPLVSVKQTRSAEVNAQATELARYFGLDTFVTIPDDPAVETGDGTLTNTMAQRGVPTLLAEAGGNGLLDEASVLLLYHGVLNVMKYLRMLPEQPQPATIKETFHGIARLSATHQGIFYPQIHAGDHVSRGRTRMPPGSHGPNQGLTHALRGAVKVFLQFFRLPSPGYAGGVHGGV